jgi:hypothetical protein
VGGAGFRVRMILIGILEIDAILMIQSIKIEHLNLKKILTEQIV